MKKSSALLLSVVSVFLAGGCEQEIIHEKVVEYIDEESYDDFGFYRRSDMALLEVELPEKTLQDDDVYVAGPFNGGEEAVGDNNFRLRKSSRMPVRYGVYVDPDAFLDGKTLADGYWFVSRKEGREVDAEGEEVIHRDAVEVAGRTVVSVASWETRFIPRDETIAHDGPVVYVKDNTGWDLLMLDVSGEAGAARLEPGGRSNLLGGKWTWFDLGAAAEGKEADLVFGNGSASLAAVHVKLDYCYYFNLTATEAVETSAFPEHAGIRVWVDDRTGWTATAMYLFGDVNDFGGLWPGIRPGGKLSYKGYDYTMFTVHSTAFGLNEQIIFNNNGMGTQLEKVPVTFSKDKPDYFYMITPMGTAAVDPEQRTGTEIAVEPEPDPEPNPDTPQYSMYIHDQTGWNKLYIHYWATGYVPRGWPGTLLSEEDKVEKYGKIWYKFDFLQADTGKLFTFYFFYDPDLPKDTRVRANDFFTLDSDKYVLLTATSVKEIDPEE